MLGYQGSPSTPRPLGGRLRSTECHKSEFIVGGAQCHMKVQVIVVSLRQNQANSGAEVDMAPYTL